jgi:3'-5' exoribonuclease
MRYISELHEGETFVEFYLCKQKQTMKSKAGKTYLSLTLGDKTGSVSGKVWDLNRNIQAFEEGDFIKIEATVVVFNNDLQLNIKKIRRAMDGEYDPAEYIPATEKDIEELYNTLTGLIASVSDKYIKQLLTNVFINNSEIANEFKVHTAAKTMHHNYLGGLLEHTISVAQLCDFMSKHYDGVNRDMLIGCALLHDISKLYELSEFPSIDYTDDGELLGHIVMGAEFIGKEADRIEGFPHKLRSLMQHCILAHHGEFEYGSPKLPKTIEAFILHAADDTDAKVKMYETAIKENKNTGSWVGYNKMLQRNIRKSDF